MKLKDSFDYNLCSTIRYQDNGEVLDGTILVLYAPSHKAHAQRIKLQQGFFRAISSIKQESETQETKSGESKIKGSEILSLMLSSDVDMVEYHKTFKELLTAEGVCKVENKQDLTNHLYEQLNPIDIDNLMGEYLANFILSSVLENLTK